MKSVAAAPSSLIRFGSEGNFQEFRDWREGLARFVRWRQREEPYRATLIMKDEASAIMLRHCHGDCFSPLYRLYKGAPHYHLSAMTAAQARADHGSERFSRLDVTPVEQMFQEFISGRFHEMELGDVCNGKVRLYGGDRLELFIFRCEPFTIQDFGLVFGRRR